MRQLPDRARTDHHIGFLVENRSDQIRDVSRDILIISVNVHDDVSALLQRLRHAALECLSETSVLFISDDVIDVELARNLARFVAATVVDDHPFDFFHSEDLARQRAQHIRKRFLLIEARNLDDEFFKRFFLAIVQGLPANPLNPKTDRENGHQKGDDRRPRRKVKLVRKGHPTDRRNNADQGGYLKRPAKAFRQA
jgi:hypothetical protein